LYEAEAGGEPMPSQVGGDPVVQQADVFGGGRRAALRLLVAPDPGALGAAAPGAGGQVDPTGAQAADDAFHRWPGDADLGGDLRGGKVIAPEVS
jgi:hypothetical protein